MDLLSLALLCGPLVDPATTLRVIDVESGESATAIHDNTSGESYLRLSAEEAVRIAEQLIGSGHRIDLGLMQINYGKWLKGAGFSVREALEPCTNIRLGTSILSAAYARALPHSRTLHEALQMALSAYHSGSETRALGYAERVLIVRPGVAMSVPHGPAEALAATHVIPR
jgi:type IV secretion system protein VirB1